MFCLSRTMGSNMHSLIGSNVGVHGSGFFHSFENRMTCLIPKGQRGYRSQIAWVTLSRSPSHSWASLPPRPRLSFTFCFWIQGTCLFKRTVVTRRCQRILRSCVVEVVQNCRKKDLFSSWIHCWGIWLGILSGLCSHSRIGTNFLYATIFILLGRG